MKVWDSAVKSFDCEHENPAVIMSGNLCVSVCNLPLSLLLPPRSSHTNRLSTNFLLQLSNIVIFH